ncbi:MAG: hypothetical protein JF612_04230 [Planctomycetia bacterium]|jgi:hypothetical protein|nr:hypothetical protein [Planctomycetia bacterium]
MTEVWLKTNRRALVLGMLLPGVLVVCCGAALAWSIVSSKSWILELLLLTLTAVPLWMLGELIYAAFQPRIAYDEGHLVVFLEPARATRVPINIVEVVFLGQGPSQLPKLNGREPETQNVVIRLADSAIDWKHRSVRPAFGHWCEGYITIRGAWCEPITADLLRKLNHRLAEVHRLRQLQAGEKSAKR